MSDARLPLLAAAQISGSDLYPYSTEIGGAPAVEVYDYDRSAVEALLARPPLTRATVADILGH